MQVGPRTSSLPLPAIIARPIRLLPPQEHILIAGRRRRLWLRWATMVRHPASQMMGGSELSLCVRLQTSLAFLSRK